jgi:hypothetical protein
MTKKNAGIISLKWRRTMAGKAFISTTMVAASAKPGFRVSPASRSANGLSLELAHGEGLVAVDEE